MSQRNPASDGSGSPPRRHTGGAWTVVAVLLGVGIVAPLLVGLYDSEDPTLWGFPFFYWFQFLMIPIVSVLTYLAFRLSQKATARDRTAFGLSAEPGEPEAHRDRGEEGR